MEMRATPTFDAQMSKYNQEKTRLFEIEKRDAREKQLKSFLKVVRDFDRGLEKFKQEFFEAFRTTFVVQIEALIKQLNQIILKTPDLISAEVIDTNYQGKLSQCLSLLNNLLDNQSELSKWCYNEYVVPLIDQFWNIKYLLEVDYAKLTQQSTEVQSRPIHTRASRSLNIYNIFDEVLRDDILIKLNATEVVSLALTCSTFYSHVKSSLREEQFDAMLKSVFFFSEMYQINEAIAKIDGLIAATKDELNDPNGLHQTKCLRPSVRTRLALIIGTLSSIGGLTAWVLYKGLQYRAVRIGMEDQILGIKKLLKNDNCTIYQECVHSVSDCLAYRACNQTLCNEMIPYCDEYSALREAADGSKFYIILILFILSIFALRNLCISWECYPSLNIETDGTVGELKFDWENFDLSVFNDENKYIFKLYGVTTDLSILEAKIILVSALLKNKASEMLEEKLPGVVLTQNPSTLPFTFFMRLKTAKSKDFIVDFDKEDERLIEKWKASMFSRIGR